MDNESATAYLTSLIGKTLRIRISDRRLFVGALKCTDRDRNIILGNAHEYREPDQDAIERAMQASLGPSGAKSSQEVEAKAAPAMTSRFVGLIVVPGEHIRTIELEEFDPEASAP